MIDEIPYTSNEVNEEERGIIALILMQGGTAHLRKCSPRAASWSEKFIRATE